MYLCPSITCWAARRWRWKIMSGGGDHSHRVNASAGRPRQLVGIMIGTKRSCGLSAQLSRHVSDRIARGRHISMPRPTGDAYKLAGLPTGTRN